MTKSYLLFFGVTIHLCYRAIGAYMLVNSNHSYQFIVLHLIIFFFKEPISQLEKRCAWIANIDIWEQSLHQSCLWKCPALFLAEDRLETALWKTLIKVSFFIYLMIKLSNPIKTSKIKAIVWYDLWPLRVFVDFLAENWRTVSSAKIWPTSASLEGYPQSKAIFLD